MFNILMISYMIEESYVCIYLERGIRTLARVAVNAHIHIHIEWPTRHWSRPQCLSLSLSYLFILFSDSLVQHTFRPCGTLHRTPNHHKLNSKRKKMFAANISQYCNLSLLLLSCILLLFRTISNEKFWGSKGNGRKER